MALDIRKTIDTSPLFKHLSEEWRDRLTDSSVLHEFEAGDPVIREGELQEHGVYVLLSGRARVVTEEYGEEIELKTLNPGAYFGEVGLLSGGEASATVEAKSDSMRVLAIDRDVLASLVDEDTRVRTMLEKVTEARAEETAGKVTSSDK
jgi:CRP-like cAMP-binding protein